ncbi:sugar ABC transporter substrate-binding protein [Actinosynnema sp. NPDC047251]|uniref:ABC-type transporter, substrate-binding lipoprotein, family 1 n=1 Tax=Saccharothrix espanaensis (strain ATCC 51144 / DSM 44229 / JCM 9112 / NBRC 15066 / NRRL 15764) TaxID=1179773 RepID=K0JY27_SACES|nr:sugar ABC transporter substrate-binding protein [Saccharothrix espanaensis]CCH30247.1 ABC-type transporter, substrate-binding lipoprotein, family 1 [Saccharothrix espanaensis DSM 44229]
MGSGLDRRSFLLVAGLLGLAACGSDTGRGGAADGTLRHWYHAYGEDGVQDAVRRYAAGYPNGKVEVQWNPGDYDSKIVTALQNSAVPDVFEAQVKVDWVRQKQVVPLDDLLGDARDDFVRTLLDSQTVDGRLYGIPQAIDTQVLFYRPSLLRQAGVTPPTTVDALLDAAERLTAGKVRGLFAGNDGGVGVLTGPLLWSAGLDFLSADGTAPGFDDPRAAAVFGKLRELNQGGGLLLGAPTDWADPGAFVDGLVAMQWTGLWNLPKITAAHGDDVGVLPFPRLDATGAVSVPVGAYSAMVNARSADVEAAKAYVKWLWVEQTDHQTEFATAFGAHLPARRGLAERAERLGSGPGREVVGFVTDSGRIAAPARWSARANTALSDAVSRIARQGADAKEELTAALDVARAEIARLDR